MLIYIYLCKRKVRTSTKMSVNFESCLDLTANAAGSLFAELTSWKVFFFTFSHKTWIDGSSCQSDDTETSIYETYIQYTFKQHMLQRVKIPLRSLFTTTTLLCSVLRIHTLCYGLWCTGWGASCFWCMVVYQNCSHVLHFWLQKLHRTHTFYCVEKWFMIITT